MYEQVGATSAAGDTSTGRDVQTDTGRGQSVVGMPWSEIQRLLCSPSRPLRLTFGEAEAD